MKGLREQKCKRILQNLQDGNIYDMQVEKHVKVHFPITQRAKRYIGEQQLSDYESSEGDDSEIDLFHKERDYQGFWQQKSRGVKAVVDGAKENKDAASY